MLSPISTTLQKAYRDTLLCNSSPAFLESDTPIVPVAIIATASSPSNSQNVIISDGTDQATVTTAGALTVEAGVGKPDSAKTKVVVSLQQTPVANTNYTLYTVTSGKTLYVKSVTMSSGTSCAQRLGASLSGNAFVSTRNNSNELVVDLGTDTNSVTYVLDGLLSFASGTVVQVECSNTGTINTTLVGWEE